MKLDFTGLSMFAIYGLLHKCVHLFSVDLSFPLNLAIL